MNPNRTSLRNNYFIKSVLYVSDQILLTSNEDDFKQRVGNCTKYYMHETRNIWYQNQAHGTGREIFEKNRIIMNGNI
jgi:hypothetical protein